MPDSIDRYPVNPLDDPATFKDALREVDRRISELEGQRFVGSQFITKDIDGTIRVQSGLLPDLTYGMEIDGGKVRALELDVQTAGTQSTVGLTTAFVTVASVSLTPPAWALSALIFGISTFQITDQTGAAALLAGRVLIDTNAGTTVNQGSSAAGQTISMSAMHARELTAPLSSPIDVHAESLLAAGTNTSNRFRLTAIAIYTR